MLEDVIAEKDPDGNALKQAYLKHEHQQAAPLTRHNVMAYCDKNDIPVHTLELNNAISMDGDGYLHPDDPETKTLIEKLAPELAGQKGPSSDETGMDAIHFDSSCFPLLSLLDRYGPMSIREIQDQLGTSHSYISQKAKSLEKDNLINTKKNPRDARSKVLSLTEEGHTLIAKAKPYWLAMDRAIAQRLGENERALFAQLQKLEAALKERSIKDLTLEEISKNNAEHIIDIVDYRPDYKEKFRSLNLEWLEKNFILKDFDYKVFEDPQKEIIDKGGDIFFVRINGEIRGTAALYPNADHSFELCKMSVDPRSRGLGLGKILIKEAEKRAQRHHAKILTLTSNSRLLQPAIRLYKEMGFTETPLLIEDIKKYGRERIDIRMEKPLAA